MLAGSGQQFKNRSPVISPLRIKTDAPAQGGGIDFAAPPLVKDVLIAGEDGFQPEDYGAVSGLGSGFQKFAGEVLRVRQSVIVAQQNNIRGLDTCIEFRGVENPFVRPKGLVVLAQIFPAVAVIVELD